jgi:hypothetical protein
MHKFIYFTTQKKKQWQAHKQLSSHNLLQDGLSTTFSESLLLQAGSTSRTSRGFIGYIVTTLT